jgi:hypothetical protein
MQDKLFKSLAEEAESLARQADYPTIIVGVHPSQRKLSHEMSTLNQAVDAYVQHASTQAESIERHIKARERHQQKTLSRRVSRPLHGELLTLSERFEATHPLEARWLWALGHGSLETHSAQRLVEIYLKRKVTKMARDVQVLLSLLMPLQRQFKDTLAGKALADIIVVLIQKTKA